MESHGNYVTQSDRQGCKWDYKKISENAGVQGPHRPWWGQGATPLWGVGGGGGAKEGNAPWEKLTFHTYGLKIGLSWTEVG